MLLLLYYLYKYVSQIGLIVSNTFFPLQGRHVSDYEVNPIRHLLERVNYMMGEVLTDVVKSNILEYADTMVRTGEIVQYTHFIIL